MTPAKRCRPVVAEQTLPEDVLLEIVARLEAATLIRCAAARRVCTNDDGPGIIPPCVLAYLHDRNKQPMVSLVHPATPLTLSFVDRSLAPYVLRCVGYIHRTFEPLKSRGGLVILNRRDNIIRRMSEPCYELCIFDPLTGDRTYIECPFGLLPKQIVLLTATDGIGCSFLLLATNMERCNESGGFRITVQATEPSGTGWGRVTQDTHSILPFRRLQQEREPVVLQGGVIHWLLSEGDQVLTYDIRTERLGTVNLPPTTYAGSHRLILGSSPDGRRLQLLDAKMFMVVMWEQLSDGWIKEAVIDVEHKIRSLYPNASLRNLLIQFKHWGERSGTVLLQAYRNKRAFYRGSLVVFDLKTKRMQRIGSLNASLLFEVDLPMRLRAMKVY